LTSHQNKVLASLIERKIIQKKTYQKLKKYQAFDLIKLLNQKNWDIFNVGNTNKLKEMWCSP